MNIEHTHSAHVEIPDKLRGRVVITDGALHISKEQRGSMELDNYVARLRRRGIVHLIWHEAPEFDSFHKSVFAAQAKASNDTLQYALDLIAKAYAKGASDIHIVNYGPYAHIDFRCLGLLRSYETISGELAEGVISCIYQSLCTETDATYIKTERQDGRIANKNHLPAGVFSVRVHTEPIQSAASTDGRGSFMALRLLFDATNAVGTLEERLMALGFLPEQVAIFRALTERTGLSIVSGPTGHGKTTVLSHVMESMSEQFPERNYMSIEDPPEYPLRGVKQIMVSTKSDLTDEERDMAYTAAIAGAMRSDLDTGMVGEIRYRSAAQASINAALTGHGMWTTVHATNALAIIPRFAEMGISLKSLCNPNVLSGLSYQRLIPKLCPQCKVLLRDNPSAIPAPTLDRLRRRLGAGISGVFVQGDGCPYCDNNGLKGQSVAAEVIATDRQLLHHLRNDDASKAYEYWIKDMGGITHVAAALKLIREGVVDPFLAEIRLGVTLDFDSTYSFTSYESLPHDSQHDGLHNFGSLESDFDEVLA